MQYSNPSLVTLNKKESGATFAAPLQITNSILLG